MATNEEQPQQQVRLTVVDPPKFDLESYISNYEGHTRLDRLHFIGVTSAYLSTDAFHMAIAEAKQGKDTARYLKLTEDFNEVSPNDPMAMTDMGWVEQKNREVKAEQEKLEHELKSYKNNLIKESIRMGNEDLGHFYYACGDYGNASKAYLRMRENCTSTKHIADLNLRLVYVSVALKSWTAVQAHVVKLDVAQLKAEERIKVDPVVSVCSGLAQMCTHNFREAATQFLTTPPSFVTLEPLAGIKWQKEILTGNDVAVYGGLCALASMDRSDLQDHVLQNNDFRNFLELEPHIRRAISLFCSSKYSACLEVLEGYRTDYLLDIYLAPVLHDIYRAIRTKCIVQYFIPFSCVTLDEMARKFQTTGAGQKIETELLEMIIAGVLNARIDLVDRLLISPPTNPRYTVHSDALAMAERYDQTLRLRLTRMNMLGAGLELRPSKHEPRENMPGISEGLGASLRGLGSRMGF
jgi:COP9 signalosome complex subunit 1